MAFGGLHLATLPQISSKSAGREAQDHVWLSVCCCLLKTSCTLKIYASFDSFGFCEKSVNKFAVLSSLSTISTFAEKRKWKSTYRWVRWPADRRTSSLYNWRPVPNPPLWRRSWTKGSRRLTLQQQHVPPPLPWLSLIIYSSTSIFKSACQALSTIPQQLRWWLYRIYGQRGGKQSLIRLSLPIHEHSMHFPI